MIFYISNLSVSQLKYLDNFVIIIFKKAHHFYEFLVWYYLFYRSSYQYLITALKNR